MTPFYESGNFLAYIFSFFTEYYQRYWSICRLNTSIWGSQLSLVFVTVFETTLSVTNSATPLMISAEMILMIYSEMILMICVAMILMIYVNISKNR